MPVGDTPAVAEGASPNRSALDHRPADPVSVAPARGPRLMTVAALPAAMAEPGRNAGFLPIIQFVKDWNHMESWRETMIADDPPPGTDPDVAARIAAVVHALCDEYGQRLPDWAMGARSATDIPLVPGIDLRSELGQAIRAAAPAACSHHRVYFSDEILDAT